MTAYKIESHEEDAIENVLWKLEQAQALAEVIRDMVRKLDREKRLDTLATLLSITLDDAEDCARSLDGFFERVNAIIDADHERMAARMRAKVERENEREAARSRQRQLKLLAPIASPKARKAGAR